MGKGLIRGRGLGGCECFFAGKECSGGWVCKAFGMGVGDGFRVCVLACAGSSDCPMGLVDKLPAEVGYVCV